MHRREQVSHQSTTTIKDAKVQMEILSAEQVSIQYASEFGPLFLHAGLCWFIILTYHRTCISNCRGFAVVLKPFRSIFCSSNTSKSCALHYQCGIKDEYNVPGKQSKRPSNSCYWHSQYWKFTYMLRRCGWFLVLRSSLHITCAALNFFQIGKDRLQTQKIDYARWFLWCKGWKMS